MLGLKKAPFLIFALVIPIGLFANDLIEKELSLKNKAEVWSQTVCLNDLIDGGWINSRCAVEKSMCCRWKMGKERVQTFSREEIRKQLGQIKIFGFALDLKGADQVVVTQTRRELTASEIQKKYIAAVTAKFSDESTKISVQSIKLLGPIFVSFDDEDAWDVIAPESLADTVPLKVVSTKSEAQVLGWVQITANAESEVYVAKQVIRPMDVLKAEHFELKQVNISAARASNQTLFRKNQFPEMMRALQTLTPGTPLTASSIERIPMVKLGDTVTLILKGDSLSISTKGVVQGSAGVGDMVNVSLPRYNRTFRGRLAEGKFVEVWL